MEMTSFQTQGQEQKKRKKGKRCTAYGCGNTSYDGFHMHELPGKMPTGHLERFSPLQKSWIAFIGRRRKFDLKDARTYSKIYVCSGHFRPEDYESTHVEMYRRRLRIRPPALKKDATPSLDVAQQPFPSSWFMPQLPPPSLASSPSTSSSTPASFSDPVTCSSSATPCTSTITLSFATSTSCTLTSSPSFAARPLASPSILDPVDTDGDIIEPEKPKRSRKESIYMRKRETADIFAVYVKRAEEERAKDILDRSKGEQCAMKMVYHKVRTRIRKRSCKLQVKPITKTKGFQSDLYEKQACNAPVMMLADASTQTTESCRKEEEAEMDESDIEVESDPDDPTYVPGRMSRSSSDEETCKVTQPANILEEEKFIVFESNLMTLFKSCVKCQATNVTSEKIRPRSYGSQLKVRVTCHSCHKIWEWHSQPKIGNLMAGNLLLSAAILYGGGSPTKVLRVLNHMNLQVISNRTFLEHQTDYLQPAVIRIFEQEQRLMVNGLPGDEKLVIGGDGRADSPGHSAKYGSYCMMDMKRKKILDVQLVQSNEVSSSNAMEKEGLARGLTKLAEMGVEVGSLITDRHTQVAKWMRENHPGIDHRYDVWHIAKGISKKITAIGKLKDCDTAQHWKKAIVNHIYWCAASTPDGNGDLMVAKFKSLLNHIRNIHEHGDIFPRCEHPADYPQREWMREGTKVFEKVSEVLTKTRLLNDLKKMSPLAQTSAVEAFHSVLLYWCPKMLAYSYAGMKCRLLLAALHWNENGDRSQATKSDGTPLYHVTYQKAKEGRQTVSKVLTACTFGYVDVLMMETLRLVAGKHKLRADIPELQGKPALCSKFQRPDRDEAIQQAEAHRRYTFPIE